ncbi:hypothetical protein P4114_00730 [Pseudomonas aeruginosa]|nr:hypothetical protein [Pseudomonas aeruginosa]
MNLQNRNNLILSLIAETQFDAYVQGYMAKAGAAAGASDNLLVEAEGAAMLQGLVAPVRAQQRACGQPPAERPAPNRPRPTVADEVATGHRGQCQLDPRDPAGHEQGYLEYRDCHRSPGRVRPTLPGHREGHRAADALRRQLA